LLGFWELRVSEQDVVSLEPLFFLGDSGCMILVSINTFRIMFSGSKFNIVLMMSELKLIAYYEYSETGP